MKLQILYKFVGEYNLNFVNFVPIVPMVAPENLEVHVVNSTLAKVRWDPVPLNLVRGHLRGYNVSYPQKFLKQYSL